MAEKKLDALSTLKALASKKNQPSGVSALATQLGDPAIAGAKRDKNVVRLGFDPNIAERALIAFNLKMALEEAQADFGAVQSDIRDYGSRKREIFNNTFKSEIKTVCIPYQPTPKNDGDAPETLYIQVICSDKYSVQKDTVLGHKESIGAELFSKLFVENRKKILKENAEEMFRDILRERCELDGEELDGVMAVLFDEEVTVCTNEHYEKEIKQAPTEVQALLKQAVTRAAPGLKFPK